VIALPNSAREEISARFTSPLKLFEAMASRRVIVASDLPSLREVLRDGENALLVRPDDTASLAAGLRRALDDVELSARLAKTAREEAGPFDWARRGELVARFLRGRLQVGPPA